ncbi:hypothetical protein [Microbulbifer pacificus]|uniref:hypothetical protein n=1 Tax=Microbulbifer pacificus TaxID=407164 RepID=UPI000CF4972E|nr:hypothetical protein [Microbulbifer pacificus]
MSDQTDSNVDLLLRDTASQWRRRGLLPYALLTLTAISITTVGMFFWPLPPWLPAMIFVFVFLALIADRQWRLSKAQLCARLDARYSHLQDSSQLLLSDANQLSPVLLLQRRRTARALRTLLAQGELNAFHPPYLRSPLLAATGACLGLLVSTLVNLQHSDVVIPDSENSATRSGEVRASAPAIVAAETLVEPPSYTGLATSTQTLQIKAPEQSHIQWYITLDAPAHALHMLAAEQTFAFTAAEPLPSRHWQLRRVLQTSDFYQLAITPTPGMQQTLLPPIHNIDITADRAPEFVFERPLDSVTVVSLEEDAQSPLLQVSVRVRDDFTVVDTDLLLTLASGSGENVRFRNERIKLHAQGDTDHQKQFRFSIPVQRYAIEPGDELYWYLEARDNRAPEANVQKSQHYILRWPQEEIFGLSDTEGMAIKVLPEYFRSQRQLIIDTEALLEDAQQISAEEFRKRSASLAYEQNLLRMRYGRFLGEEDSALEEAGHDEGNHQQNASGHGDESEHGHDHDETAGGHSHESGNGSRQFGDGSSQFGDASSQFGDASGVVAAAGHQHDSSDHATLFDPRTKELLRSALNAMWSAWRDLSVIEPQASLPYQHTALRYIKEVQQASRIYLQRVGFETPPLDESRRLSAEYEPPVLPKVESSGDDSERMQLLALLDKVQRGDIIAESEEQSLKQRQILRDDADLRMSLAKHLRRYRQQPDCSDCRRRLSALLYGLIPAPEARPTLPRIRPGEGEYGDWLQQTQGDTQ